MPMPMVAADFRSRSRSPRPLTAHRWFPATVALWFAALLGLGSLVLPASLFEAAVGASGIASVGPGAEPPLGLTPGCLGRQSFRLQVPGPLREMKVHLFLHLSAEQ